MVSTQTATQTANFDPPATKPPPKQLRSHAPKEDLKDI